MSGKIKKLIGADDKCSCKGYNLDKLLQPNILMLLANQSLHGYSIIQELESKALFQGEKADNTGVYRTLGRLEERGMIRFEWALESSGPAKKIYHITDEGRECLVNWAATLENYRNAIDKMIADLKLIISD